MTINDPYNYFIANALWVGKYPHDGTAWVEGGVTIGQFYPDGHAENPVFYYASKMDNGGLYSEDTSGVEAPLGQEDRVSIHYAGGTSWLVTINFSSHGSDRSIHEYRNAYVAPSKYLVAGLEETRVEDRAWATDNNFYYRDRSNGDHPDWSTSGAGHALASEVGADSDVYWINEYTAIDAAFGYHTC